jgi:hypothetical protein
VRIAGLSTYAAWGSGVSRAGLDKVFLPSRRHMPPRSPSLDIPNDVPWKAHDMPDRGRLLAPTEPPSDFPCLLLIDPDLAMTLAHGTPTMPQRIGGILRRRAPPEVFRAVIVPATIEVPDPGALRAGAMPCGTDEIMYEMRDVVEMHTSIPSAMFAVSQRLT